MRFIDWNGSGRLDPSDIATSVGIDVAQKENEEDQREEPKQKKPVDSKSSEAGCLTVIALIVISWLVLILSH